MSEADELGALASLAVKGDGAALSTLCRRLETPVYRLCLRMLGDPRDAEDAAQDVLVKVVTNLGSFEGRSALSTWVHQIAVRHVLAVKKSRAEERSLDEEAFAALLERGLAFGARLPPTTPEDRALAIEVRLSCTQGMLLLLSREDRLMLVLVDFLGFAAGEAAELAGVSHGAMRQRLSRARSRLGTFLQAKCGEVNAATACRCERQVAGKRAQGLTGSRLPFSALATGDLGVREDASLAMAELEALRRVARAFQAGGEWRAPATLRERMQRLLPTVLCS